MKAIALTLLLLVLVPTGASAKPDTQHCDGIALPLLSCVTSGHLWVIAGTSGDDQLHGTVFDDLIHSRRGADVIHGGGGYDVCWVQPSDRWSGCEELQ